MGGVTFEIVGPHLFASTKRCEKYSLLRRFQFSFVNRILRSRICLIYTRKKNGAKCYSSPMCIFHSLWASKKKKDNRFTRVSWWPTQWCHLVGRKCVKLDWNGKPDSNANAAATLFDLTHTLLILDGDNPLNVCVCIMQKWESVLFPVL